MSLDPTALKAAAILAQIDPDPLADVPEGPRGPRSPRTSGGINPPGPVSPNLPDDFWNARPTLQRIRQAAHARTRSADAVLGAVLARVSALTPPLVRLPAPVGSLGTLDVVVAIIGHAGSGKSSSAGTGGELTPINDDDVAVVPLGSGEGLIEAYLDFVDEVDDDGKTRRVKRQTRRGVLALLDEGQALAEMGGRKGSTLLPTIRTAWSGGDLGQANASEDRKRHLKAGEYRFAMIAGFQTEYATALLDDAAGGTPQRFVFFAAEDPSIPDVAPPWPSEAWWTPPTSQARVMDLDVEVAAEIRGRALARSRGLEVVDPLDSHRDLSRLKVAGLLAILDSRQAITVEDWHLAGIILDASDRVRGDIAAAARWRAQHAEKESTDRAVRRAATLEVNEGGRALQAMAKAIARHVHKGACDDGCRRRCATHATASKHRQHATVDDAIEKAEREGWIEVDGEEIRPGEVTP